MNKKDLRRVDFFLNVAKDFHSVVHTSTSKDVLQGWFHGWAQCGNQEEGLEKYALIEDDTGLIHEVATHRIRFFT